MAKIIKFGDIEIEKQKIHQNEEPISIKNIDISKEQYTTKFLFVKDTFKNSKFKIQKFKI